MPPQQQQQQRQRPRRISEYGKRLAAKQETRNAYGLRERQFRNYFALARKDPKATGAKLLELLERRLDNVVYRLDLTQSRRQARQWVTHGHIAMNGKRITIPSYQVQIGDSVTLIHPDIASSRGVEPPSWLVKNAQSTGGEVLRPPTQEDFPEADTQLIIEYYSR